MRIILLNGPPRSGKDFGAEYLQDKLRGAHAKFADDIKERTHDLYGLRGWGGKPRSADYFEEFKDEPLDEFLGATPRQAYISVGESFKKLHGQGIWGKLLVKDIRGLPSDKTIVISDSGFVEEALELVKEFGADNILLVRISREGYDFSNDSRSYIDLSEHGVRCVVAINRGDDTFGPHLLDLVTT